MSWNMAAMKTKSNPCSFWILAGSLAFATAAQAADVLPSIPKGDIAIQLNPVATGLGAPDYAISPPGDTARLFIVEQKGLLLILQNGTLLATSALDIQTMVSPPLSPTSANDERGLLGLAFHPGFANPTSPGFRTLYTYNSQPIPSGGSPTFAAPNGATQNYENAVNEWKMSAGNPNTVDPLSRREVVSFGKNASNHNGGTIAFGPDGYLYLGLGDGGNANDLGASHIEPDGNSQNLSTPLGKMLRFDPLDPALTSASPNAISGNGQYRIPADNPFQGAGEVKEIFAYGFRNPYRFAFDRLNGQLIVADVGQNTVEEIDRAVIGGNFGWAMKEGDFAFNRTTGPGGIAGSVGVRSPGVPAGLIDPISGPSGTLEYDHDDGISITGGFVYRGSRIPALYGKYVFGDLALHAGAIRADGRLFYADLDSGAIREFLLPKMVGGILPGGLTVHGFGEDANGELYALVTNTPSNGTGGIVYAIGNPPVVWNGPPVTFTKAPGADFAQPENQDRITPGVWITRANSQGIFNIKAEPSYTHNVSPVGTEWAAGTTADFETLTYSDWETWTGKAVGGGPPGTVGQNAVLHLIAENTYIDITFHSWASATGGGFSYVRSTAPLTDIEAWRQLHFNSPANAGDAADDFDFDHDGLVNLIEFAFGLDPKQGASLALPQPQIAAGNLTVAFNQPAGVSGITYGAEWSTTLDTAHWTNIPDTGSGTSHLFTVPVGGANRFFMRYRVTTP
jgi:glucose/arabinose dehydrogenase